MKMVHYDDKSGRILGYYDESIHTVIPSNVVEITEEEWKTAVDMGYNYIDISTNIMDCIDFRTEQEISNQIISDRNASSRKYLAETDWYIVRQIETGVPIPQEILDARAEARLSVI